MKKLLTTIAILLVTNIAFAQTEWAPVGAKWWQIVDSVSYCRRHEDRSHGKSIAPGFLDSDEPGASSS